jgi:hypothetical protein
MQSSVVNSVPAVRDLWPAVLVALTVAVAFTVAASVFEQFHQVAAEDLNGHEVPAVSVGHSTQVMDIKPWGVQLKLPLGQDQPLLSYAAQGPDSVGLSSVALAQFGPSCRASRNGAGALLRLKPAAAVQAGKFGQVLGSVGGYDYVYQLPQNPCMQIEGAANMAAQQAIAIEGAGELAPGE